MRLKEHGAAQAGFRGEDSGIETLKMARLQNAAMLFGESDEIICFRKRCCERLFDEEIKTSLKQRRGHAIVMHGRHRNRGCVDCQVTPQQFINGQKDGNTVLRFDFGSASCIRFKRSDKLNTCAGLFELAIDTEMIAPEGPAACHGDT
jgi:hypothetical protein